MSKQTHAHSQTRRARLARLPPIAQHLISNPEMARQFLDLVPFGRMMIAAGLKTTPGFGLAEYDAMNDIIRDAIGVKRLSDEEFEHALILSTPPEYRGTLQ
jgi:hypothetical protein